MVAIWMLKINFKLQVKVLNLLKVFVFLNSNASVTKINGKNKSVYEIANMAKRNAGWFCCHTSNCESDSHCQWDVFYIYAHGQRLLSALAWEASLCTVVKAETSCQLKELRMTEGWVLHPKQGIYTTSKAHRISWKRVQKECNNGLERWLSG